MGAVVKKADETGCEKRIDGVLMSLSDKVVTAIFVERKEDALLMVMIQQGVTVGEKTLDFWVIAAQFFVRVRFDGQQL